jgi:hypothetical protein
MASRDIVNKNDGSAMQKLQKAPPAEGIADGALKMLKE